MVGLHYLWNMVLITILLVFCVADSLVALCLCACTVCCPPLSLPLSNCPTELIRECRSVKHTVRNHSFHGEIKDNYILRKAVKFTGQQLRGGMFFILWVRLWTSPPGCIFCSRKTRCSRRRQGTVNKRAYLLWCYDVTMLMFCGCFLYFCKGMLILTDVGATHKHKNTQTRTQMHTCCADLVKPLRSTELICLCVHVCFCFNEDRFHLLSMILNVRLIMALVWLSLLQIPRKLSTIFLEYFFVLGKVNDFNHWKCFPMFEQTFSVAS